MKKIIVIFVFVTITSAINSQWYHNSFNVLNINELNQDQLNLSLTKANKSIETGKIMTGIGLVTFTIGAAVYSNGINDIQNSSSYSGIDEGLNTSFNGIYLIYAGGIAASIGIPLWISGYIRKNDIEIALIKFQPTGAINGVGLKFNF